MISQLQDQFLVNHKIKSTLETLMNNVTHDIYNEP